MKAIKHLLAGALVTVGLGIIGGMNQAEAASITSTLTADNHYGLFTGNESGSDLNFIGRNEYGASGSTGGYNWSKAETWTFDLNPQDYLYVVVWDDGRVDESWIGEFNIDFDGDGQNDEQLLSLAEDWEYIIANSANPGDMGEVPTDNELFGEISNADWTGAQRRGDNGMRPWGFIDGISADADFLNTTTPSNGRYTIFRTTVAVNGDDTSVPEPGVTLALLAVSALGGTKVFKGRKKQ